MTPPEFTTCWFVDFEFHQADGEAPVPICLVAHEQSSGTKIELFGDQLTSRTSPPYPVDSSALIVAYAATAELSCHLALGWALPHSVLDLYAEFRCLTNGLSPALGNGILGASHYFGLPVIEASEKEAMRGLAIRGGPFNDEEHSALLSYCAGDVRMLARLHEAMLPWLDMPRAVLRGRYIRALAQVEARGLPIDVESLALLQSQWETLKTKLIDEFDEPYGLYEGTKFRVNRFERWLRSQTIVWPKLPSGRLQLDDSTFKAMLGASDDLNQVRELRRTQGTMRSFNLLAVVNGRGRISLKPWQSKTGRNQPSNTAFIFGLPAWMRGLLKPSLGRALSYVDWSQQEFGIAAALSSDKNMMAAYASGDPYLAFAIQAAVVPPNATKATHAAERDQYKACVLATQYGMGEESLALRIQQTPAHARVLLQQHRRTYRTFWTWSDRVLEHALSERVLRSTFGWTLQLWGEINERSIRNFPMQSNGAEMMRIACILAVEAGIEVCAPVHDAFVIEADIDAIDGAEERMQQCMVEASRLVLDGFELRAEAKRICHPERYEDARGAAMWERIMALLRDSPTDDAA